MIDRRTFLASVAAVALPGATDEAYEQYRRQAVELAGMESLATRQQNPHWRIDKHVGSIAWGTGRVFYGFRGTGFTPTPDDHRDLFYSTDGRAWVYYSADPNVCLIYDW
jgi:hypothetical protein